MGKIDTSEWKEFKLGYIMVGNKKQGHGLFEIVNSVAYHGKDVTETDSDDGINYITRSKFNNGLKARVVRLDKFKVNPAGTISFGAENADFFYQTEPYITGNKMYYIDTTALSVRACRFLKSIMEATFTANYSFSDGMIPARIYDECIKLPATPDGAPDWAYMESYMANIETKVAESLTMLQAAKDAEKKKVDTREWGEFKFGDLFDLHGIKQAKSQKLIPTVELSDGIPCVPYIVQSQFNNMVGRYVDKQWLIKNNEPPVEGNALVLGVTLNACSYQPEEFGASQVITARSPCLNKNNGFFIAAIVRKRIEQFDYKEKPSFEKYRALKIMLPIDKTGQPDWAYMEEYMRKVEERVKKTINTFCVIRKIKYDC